MSNCFRFLFYKCKNSPPYLYQCSVVILQYVPVVTICLSLKDLFFCQHFSKNEPQIDLSNSIGSKNALVAEIPQGHLELTNSCNVVKPSYHKLVNWVDFS